MERKNHDELIIVHLNIEKLLYKNFVMLWKYILFIKKLRKLFLSMIK